MEITPKIIFSIFGGLGIIGILWALFKFIVIKFFENILDDITYLMNVKNDHADRIKAIETACNIRHSKTDYEKGFVE